MHADPAAKIQPLTLVAWGDLDEDEPGELVDGLLEEEEVPTHRHERIAAWLLVKLFQWAERRGGLCTGSDTKLAVGPRRGRKPDVSVFLPPALPNPDDSVVRVSPVLVVEVVSPRPRDARRDRVDKLRDYTRLRARHYFIVDPQLRTFEAYELVGGRYTLVHSASGGRVARLRGLAALTLDLDAMWAHGEVGRAPGRRRPART